MLFKSKNNTVLLEILFEMLYKDTERLKEQVWNILFEEVLYSGELLSQKTKATENSAGTEETLSIKCLWTSENKAKGQEDARTIFANDLWQRLSLRWDSCRTRRQLTQPCLTQTHKIRRSCRSFLFNLQTRTMRTKKIYKKYYYYT